MSSSLKGWPRCHPHRQRSPTCSRRTPHHAQRPPRWYLDNPHPNTSYIFSQSLNRSSQFGRLNSGWMLDVAHAPDSIGLSQLLPQAFPISLDFFASQSSLEISLGSLTSRSVDTTQRLLPLVSVI
jgi:hypothetical protein